MPLSVLGHIGAITGRALVSVLVWPVNRLESTAAVTFHIDTAADRTLLIPSDARRVGIGMDHLDMGDYVLGLGGTLGIGLVPAILGFTEGGQIHLFRVDLGILPDRPEHSDTRMASLLGRDVLDRIALLIDPCHDIVQLDIHGSDEQIVLPGAAGR